MRWITRERVKVDRVACPWLIKKFVDPDAEFLFVPANTVMDVAAKDGAIPYDVYDDLYVYCRKLVGAPNRESAQ